MCPRDFKFTMQSKATKKSKGPKCGYGNSHHPVVGMAGVEALRFPKLSEPKVTGVSKVKKN